MRCRVGCLAMLAAQCALAGDLRLIEAVKEQDRKTIDSLLQARIDINSPQPDGATALSWAVYLDQKDTIAALLKAGAKVNTADEYGDTPLTLACTIGDGSI